MTKTVVLHSSKQDRACQKFDITTRDWIKVPNQEALESIMKEVNRITYKQALKTLDV